jgi:hypothetical protein
MCVPAYVTIRKVEVWTAAVAVAVGEVAEGLVAKDPPPLTLPVGLCVEVETVPCGAVPIIERFWLAAASEEKLLEGSNPPPPGPVSTEAFFFNIPDPQPFLPCVFAGGFHDEAPTIRTSD